MGRHTWSRWAVGLVVLGVCGATAFAEPGVKDKNGVPKGSITDIKSQWLSDQNDGSTYTLKGEAVFPLLIRDFTIHADATTAIVPGLSTLTSPAITARAGSPGIALRWDNASVSSKAQVKLRVPDDYLSGGKFRVICARDGGTQIAPALAFQVFVDTNQTAFDTAATAQTAVAMSAVTNGGSPEELTLNVVTDFDSLAAGQLVTLELWRDTVNASTEGLEVRYAQFVYTAQH